ncbi:hypothetical protein Tco_0415392 [Tanacetum coccineum]
METSIDTDGLGKGFKLKLVSFFYMLKRTRSGCVSCCVVKEVCSLIFRWWDVPVGVFDSYDGWLSWILRQGVEYNKLNCGYGGSNWIGWEGHYTPRDAALAAEWNVNLAEYEKKYGRKFSKAYPVIVTGVLSAKCPPDLKDVRCDLEPVLVANYVSSEIIKKNSETQKRSTLAQKKQTTHCGNACQGHWYRQWLATSLTKRDHNHYCITK